MITNCGCVRTINIYGKIGSKKKILLFKFFVSLSLENLDLLNFISLFVIIFVNKKFGSSAKSGSWCRKNPPVRHFANATAVVLLAWSRLVDRTLTRLRIFSWFAGQIMQCSRCYLSNLTENFMPVRMTWNSYVVITWNLRNFVNIEISSIAFDPISDSADYFQLTDLCNAVFAVHLI